MAMKNNINYSEISKAKISESRNVVISNCSKGGYTVAQQLIVKENDKSTTVFMKGAFHVDSIEGLYELRDALNLAIESCENEVEENDDEIWDEE